MLQTVPKDQLTSYIDRELPPSDWLRIEQDRIDAFADATLDHQFIHVDREKAAKTPFGTTIAHGYLTLSLLPHLTGQCGVVPECIAMAINYGSDKIRFLQPVKVDSEVRAHVKLKDVSEKRPGQILTRSEVTIEIKGEEKPAMVAETLALYFLQ